MAELHRFAPDDPSASRRAWTLVPLALLMGAAVACSDSNGASNNDGSTNAVNLDGGTGDARGDGAQSCPGPKAPTVGSCAKDKLEVFQGQYQVVMTKLAIGGNGEGFDLNNADCDDDPLTGADNVLWPIGALAAQSVNESMDNGEIVLPLEFFGLDDPKSDDCLNFAIYLGRFPPDRDGDGDGAGGAVNKPGKDCNDLEAEIGRKVAEVAGNGVDDNCDGLADEDGTANPPTPSTDTADADGDGQTIAAGDCDDRPTKGATIKKGAPEICNDGLDNDCSGFADDGCLPWTAGQSFPIESAAVTDSNEGVITFRGAKIDNGHLKAGPSLFSITIRVTKDTYLDLKLSYVFFEADVSKDSDGLKLTGGMLGGVLSAQAMDTAPNLIADAGFGLGSKEDSLLDALVGPAGQLLALPSDAQGNRVPDIDVDGDGAEKFLDKNLDGDDSVFRVDTCIDGDGTVFEDKYDAQGKVVERCTDAKDAQGNPRFVDGWSISLKFEGGPATMEGIVQPKE